MVQLLVRLTCSQKAADFSPVKSIFKTIINFCKPGTLFILLDYWLVPEMDFKLVKIILGLVSQPS